MTGGPIPPSIYSLHNRVQYSHGISILQICLLVILAACCVYANPVLGIDLKNVGKEIDCLVNAAEDILH
jgi:hypothetical protein